MGVPREEGPAYLAITLRSMQIQPHAGADKNVHRPASAMDKISSTASYAGGQKLSDLRAVLSGFGWKVGEAG